MNRYAIALCALIMSTEAIQAAGVSKVYRTTVNETTLQGYVASPPAGWTQVINYNVATAATEPVQNQKLAVLSLKSGGSNATYWANPVGLTLISVTNGAILSKENLPLALQLAAADCNFPNYSTNPLQNNGCPPYYQLFVRLESTLPGRLIVEAQKAVYAPGSAKTRRFIYALDPAAAIGSADRWTLIIAETTSYPPGPVTYLGGGGSVDQLLYFFRRATATTTQVFQIVNK